MSRRLLWALPLLAAACTGLYFDRGNAFPCDFSKGPGVRDSACVAGDVCGSNNVCQKYIYEGPRFETVSVPSFGAGTSEGTVIHPLVLAEPLIDVSRELPFHSATSGSFYAHGQSDSFFAVSEQGNVLATPPIPVGANAATVQPFNSNGPHVLLRATDGSFFIDGVLPRNKVLDVPTPPAPLRLRFVDGPLAGRFSEKALPLLLNSFAVGLIEEEPGTPPPPMPPSVWRVRPVGLTIDAGLLDVAGLAQPQRLWLATLGNEGLIVTEVSRLPDAGFALTAAGSEPLTPLPGASTGELHTDREGRIITAIRRGTRSSGATSVDVLSTWQVTFNASGPVLTQAWPDCQPCQRAQQVEVLSASVATGAPVIEVICGPGTRTPLRVVGSVALTQTDACRTEAFETPVPFSRVNGLPDGGRAQWESQAGLLFGGTHGEIWSGETISTLEPLFLDRVPKDVAPSLTSGQPKPSIAAIGHDYLSVLQTDATLQFTDAGLEQLNGFRRIDPKELGVSDDERLLGLVHGTPGWGVTGTGEVVRTVVAPTGLTIATAGRVVSSVGAPIHDSIGGEAYIAGDGGLQAIFVAADDGLYFVKEPRNLVNLNEVLLTPDLIPEPSVPIRSLALERTRLGTDGVGRARGYLVTSRNVFEWQLSGTPARWSSRPLALSGGEPLEVWFDSIGSALGRVGFRDGEIDSLPGGYELVEPLPGDDAGVTPQVTDYENLGGWPVAYASTGLFIAGWDFVNGKLENRFPDGGINRPMTWRAVTLPDGGTPWMKTAIGPRGGGTRDAKLFVVIDPIDAAGLQDHRLLLFLEDQVIQVAHHLRKP